MAARMKTPIDDEEQISMIVHLANPSISGYLVSHPYANFTQLICSEEQVEAGIRARGISPWWPYQASLIQPTVEEEPTEYENNNGSVLIPYPIEEDDLIASTEGALFLPQHGQPQ